MLPQLDGRYSLVALLAAACHGPPGDARPISVDAGSSADARPDAMASCDLSGTPADVDLLFVIGNGPRSGSTQTVLSNALELFFERLACQLGAPPNLHVGVISTNMGAGGFAIPRCGGAGDDGALLSAPRIAGCDAPSDPFAIDIDDGAGRTRNFAGPIDRVVQCVGALGSGGCTFEQPLAAAVRATSGGRNPGFVRAGAVLGIVFASGGDDCSAADPDLFDPSAVDTLGPVGGFRCFEQGIECNPDTPRTVGEKTNCAPRPPGLVESVTDLAATLRSRKADPSNVVIGFIGGIPNDVAVINRAGVFELASACPAPLDAAPAVRMSAIPDALGALTCLPSPSNLSPIADAIAAAATD